MNTTMVQALNYALRASMEENDRVLVMGEDVGELGGVFRVTDGLQKDFGPDRVMNSLLAESSIVGRMPSTRPTRNSRSPVKSRRTARSHGAAWVRGHSRHPSRPPSIRQGGR